MNGPGPGGSRWWSLHYRFGVALEIPGEWVILARRELLDDWAPVIKQADPDDAEAPATDTDNNSNNSG